MVQRSRERFPRTLSTVMIIGAALLVPQALAHEPSQEKPAPQESVAQESVAQDSGPEEQSINVFEGRVFAADGKTPVAGASLSVVAERDGFLYYTAADDIFAYAMEEKVFFFFTKLNGLRCANIYTDDEGHFTIKGLREGAYHIVTAHEDHGFAFVRSVSQPNEGKPIDIRLEPPTFVEGELPWLAGENDRTSVRLDYEPAGIGIPYREEIDAARVIISPDMKLEDTGSFRLGPLPATGDPVLSVERNLRKRRFSAPLLRVPVQIARGKTTKLDIDPNKGETISAKVKGPGGEPLEDVSVVVESTTGDELTRPLFGTVTDAEGEYVIRGVPEGAYTLTAERRLPRTGFG